LIFLENVKSVFFVYDLFIEVLLSLTMTGHGYEYLLDVIALSSEFPVALANAVNKEMALIRTHYGIDIERHHNQERKSIE